MEASMKTKILIAFLMVTILSMLLSCNLLVNNSEENIDKYSIYKNFNIISRTIAEYGEPVVGVLLKYTNDGNYNNDVFPVDEKTFAIYCLFDQHGFNGDNMEFNYVLYVPEGIVTEYINQGGAYPQSGNPFWWYMKKFMNSSINVILNDWPSTIDILIGNNDMPVPKNISALGW